MVSFTTSSVEQLIVSSNTADAKLQAQQPKNQNAFDAFGSYGVLGFIYYYDKTENLMEY